MVIDHDNVDDSTSTEPVMEKIHHHDVSSSSSDCESEKHISLEKNRLFGRKKPVHAVFGGGKSADIILWRDKQMSASILGSVTVIWLLFEWLGYHLLTFVCHSLILCLAVMFLWSNLSSFIHRSPPKFPEVILPEELFLTIAFSVRHEINRAFFTFREVAAGKDLKKFLMVVVVLWLISVIGGWFNFLTLSYIVLVMLHTVPFLYEKHEDKVDNIAGKALVEINKQYAVLDEKVLQKIPKCSFIRKDQKQQ
ncbi:hypothetical protein Scep_014677 [Stephania cephalantha]|uniref:Reticulon-like protein n=1 Tax=Stephania cephalantha TaxID=152367 RepID=A0AAP0P393_9MAGN